MLEAPDIIEKQYNSLRSNNILKKIDNGKSLFIQLMTGELSPTELAEMTGKSQPQFSQLRKRLLGDKIDRKHFDQVSKTHKKIKSAQNPKFDDKPLDEDDSIVDAVNMFRTSLLKTYNMANKMMKMHYKYDRDGNEIGIDAAAMNSATRLMSESKSMMAMWITSWATLDSATVAETVSNQEDKVEELLAIVASELPEKLPELVAMLED